LETLGGILHQHWRPRPHLPGISDPIPLFAQRYRSGQLAPSGRPVRAGTVADALTALGQAFSSVGAPDPRYNATGQVDIRLHRLLQCFSKTDSPPSWVKPLPVQVVRHVLSLAHSTNATAAPRATCIADMADLAFFFLLRPGVYTVATDTTPFRFEDCKLLLGQQVLNTHTSPAADILATTSVQLVFTTQKNGVRGKVVTHGLSSDTLCCPVRAAAPDHTPLATYWSSETAAPTYLQSTDVTAALRFSVAIMGQPLGLLPADVCARAWRRHCPPQCPRRFR
jgi:hypothetical protein